VVELGSGQSIELHDEAECCGLLSALPLHDF
jgi:hypothetical protein